MTDEVGLIIFGGLIGFVIGWSMGMFMGIRIQDRVGREYINTNIRQRGWSITTLGYRVVGHIEKEQQSSIWIKEEKP